MKRSRIVFTGPLFGFIKSFPNAFSQWALLVSKKFNDLAKPKGQTVYKIKYFMCYFSVYVM